MQHTAVAGQESAAGTVITVTDDTFADLVLRSDRPVVVDFWANWCPPCTVLSARLVELAGEFAGQLTVAMVDTDENPRLARDYGVLSVPTLLIFRDGELVTQMIGARPKSQLRAALTTHAGL